MTGKHVIWAIVIGALAVVGLILLHLALPTDASWRTNRLLHLLWQVLAGLVGTGAVVWMMWRRPKAPRRDEDRLRARRKVIGVAIAIVVAVGLVVFGEMRRESASRSQLLAGPATADLEAIGKALGDYAKDHAGAKPATIEELVPKYLQPCNLYYPFRDGPAPLTAPAETGQGSPPPSYALARQIIIDTRTHPEPRFIAYLRPGAAWAPVTAALDKTGKVEIVGEEVVKPFERQFDVKP
jgi:hypothetical protein